MTYIHLLLLLGLGAVSFTLYRKLQLQEKKLTQLSKKLGHQELEQAALVNADLVFARQMAEINRQLTSIDTQVQQLETKRDNDGGYQHALRILQMGGDKEEIMASCHLSNAEAELLLNLNAYRSALRKNASASA